MSLISAPCRHFSPRTLIWLRKGGTTEAFAPASTCMHRGTDSAKQDALHAVLLTRKFLGEVCGICVKARPAVARHVHAPSWIQAQERICL